MRWRLVDKIESMTLGESATGWVNYDPDLPLFQDHFPGFAVVPGVLIMESLAQLSGKLIGYTVRKERGDWPFPILSMMEKVKFRRFVHPGTEIELGCKMISLRDEMAAMSVRARVDGRVHAQAEQVFVFNAVALPDQQERERVEEIERSELARLWSDYPGDF